MGAFPVIARADDAFDPNRRGKVFRSRWAGLACFIATALSAPVHAQQAGLQITLRDATTGAPVSGIQVDIRNPDLGLVREAISDNQGTVRIEALPTGGSYEISTRTAPLHEAAGPATVSLRSNFAQTVTLQLRPVGESDIVVTAMRAVTEVNAVNAEVSASLKREELTALPVEGRDVISALVRLPNVVPSTGFFPEAPGISINGSNGLDTNYLLDGLDNNENFLGGIKFPVPLGFARDVTVLANSYSVQYGRTANGVVNITSPSGQNDLRGELYTLVRPGRPLDARSAFPRRDLSGNAVGESFERFQTGASVSGAVARDQTFFALNLEYTRDRNLQVVDAPALGAVGNVTGRNRFLFASARVDHLLTEEWSLGLRANVGRVLIDRPGGALGGGNATFPSAGSDQTRNSVLVAATASYSGAKWSYDGALQYSGFAWDYARPKGSAGPQVTVRDPSGLTVAIVGNPGYVFDEKEDSWQTTHRLQRRIGDHRLSIGADLLRSRFALRGGGNPDGNFLVDLTAAQLQGLAASGVGLGLDADDVLSLDPQVAAYTVELQPSAFGTSQTQIAVYLEDEWQLGPKLTATLGIRWDYDSLTEKGGKDGDFDNVAPRLALNYRPSARSALRFGAGLFYGKLSYAVISDAFQRNTRSSGLLNQLRQLQARGIVPAGAELRELTFDGNLGVSPPCARVSECPSPQQVSGLRETATLAEARILNPRGYQSPWSLQLSGGYQIELSNRITLSADLIYSRTRNLVRLRDLNAPAPFTPNGAALDPATLDLLRSQPDNAARLALARQLGLVRLQAEADASRPVPVLPGGARQITVSETQGKSTYRALILQANKPRGSDAFAFRFAYTLGKLTNDTDDINFRASDANDFSAEQSPSANDRRHVISSVAYLYPARGLTVSVAGLFQSGQPVNLVPDARVFGTQDLNGDGFSFGESYVGNSDRFPGTRRNAGRLPWSATVDLGLRYSVPAFEGALELSADIFNVFNTNNESGFANAATTSNQIQFGGGGPFTQRNAGPPRQVQLGMAFRF
jgi:outer membrane receptor protein involved in Fe transport